MSNGEFNFTLKQGESRRIPLVWKANGVAVNLIGCTAKMQLRRKIADEDGAEPLYELSTANGRIGITAAEGKVELIFDDSAFIGAKWRDAVYDLEITFPDGTVKRLVEGKVTLRPEVTR
ncbi:MAG TPA: hypothetical protein VEF04_04645 [Blastocatellia bacterium]|nr:hypothetical protein [Blastocatellia bacterium]